MLILSNCLTDVADEGCLQVANSLIKRIKMADAGVTVVSYERRSPLTDVYLKLNKLLLNKKLICLLRERRESVLYIPFPARSISTAVRIFLLSCISPEKVNVVLTMTGPHNAVAKLLLKMSGAHLFALSRASADFYASIVGSDRVTYLKTGVDTARFVPALPDQVKELKQKYGLDPERKTVLHVGHMKAGRNVAELMKLDPKYQVLLVISTLTKADQDKKLREQLQKRPDIKIIDSYVPDIQEIYQLSDVYFFPVIDRRNCIDVPLSVLEAASCGKPVVTTKLGEMKEFVGKDGFYFIESFEADALNVLTDQALTDRNTGIRVPVLEYDWNHAVSCLTNLR